MTECKVMIMASLKKVKARFREYEDMNAEFIHVRDESACGPICSTMVKQILMREKIQRLLSESGPM